MAQETHFPFRLNNAFLTSLRFSRQAEMPEALDLKFRIEVAVVDESFPNRIQINLKIETLEEPPLPIFLELVGLFDLVEGQPEPDRSIIWNFINERALFILWPYVTQTIRQITGQMGANPVNIETPHQFEFLPASQAEESAEA